MCLPLSPTSGSPAIFNYCCGDVKSLETRVNSSSSRNAQMKLVVRSRDVCDSEKRTAMDEEAELEFWESWKEVESGEGVGRR